jgi:hypothetical protein
MLDYNFPGVPSPFHHQIQTAKNLIANPRHQVWNEIGTGKTFSCAWAVDYLMRHGAVKHVLLIAPISTLEVVWSRSFFRVNADLDIAICKGTADKRREIISRIIASHDHPTITIINPDGLHIIADHPACSQLDLVVVDESAMFRNSSSRRYDALCKLVGNHYIKKQGTLHGKPHTRKVLDKERTAANWQRGFWPMTGSPRPEQPTDIWAIAALVSPERVPKYFSHFRDLTMVRQDQFTWVARPESEKIIGDMLKGTVTRYTREECFDLPPTLFYRHDVNMTAEQKELTRKLKKEALAEVDAGLIKGSNKAVIVNKFLQIFSGAVKATNAEGDATMQRVDCEPKLTALDELLESSSGPVIVASEFIGAIARLVDHCERDKIPYRVVLGDTSKDDRRAAFDDLQANKYKVLIAHPRTIAHGLTLTTSNTILWWTPIYSHEIYEQFCGRITRPGQTKNTYIIHFTCSALERMVLDKLEKKKEAQNVLLKYLEGKDD